MTLSFSKLGTYGRFGNQLFQISGVLGLAEKHGAKAAFPEWPYEDYFVNPIPHGPQNENIVKEKEYNYHEWELPGSCDILGYFQSEKYFPKNTNPFVFNKWFIEQVKEKVPYNLFDKDVILIQIRRTDYVMDSNYFQVPITYYIKALQKFFPDWRNMQLAFVSDDIAYCKVHFEFLPNTYFFEGSDVEQMAFMSMCDHFIIANSSFGWWGSWLAEHQNTTRETKVIHCGRLHAGKLLLKTNESDYYPERWTEYKEDGYKIDLTDTTFTVPVYFDHKDRKQNLDLSICLLQKCFDTNIIVGEQGVNPKFEYMAQYCKYVRFTGMQFFHRTKMLNDMAMMAETPYIANWDADVIIPPFQILMTVVMLREGKDMIFPYDGRFARLNRDPWFKEIEKLLDIGAIGDEEPKGRRGKPVPESSVGGAIFFNKESFIDGGMENEYMISYGPEDCERNDRFTMLGFQVDRVAQLGTGLGGCLYHINHWCGPDSSRGNQFFSANHAELATIRGLNRDSLREYVDTWPWRHKYTESYYKRITEGSIESAKEVYKELFSPSEWSENPSIIDIGCGVGEWSCGNPNYAGVDYKIPKKSLIIKSDHYMECNLEKSTTFKIEDEVFKMYIKGFDLCICLEVLEHIPKERDDILVTLLCELSNKVLFSAAIPNQGGTGHVNEQWQTYWESKFLKHGFRASVNQPDIRNNPKIELWYRQNIVLYEKIINGMPFSFVEDFVLPEYYTQIVGNLKNQLNQKNI